MGGPDGFLHSFVEVGADDEQALLALDFGFDGVEVGLGVEVFELEQRVLEVDEFLVEHEEVVGDCLQILDWEERLCLHWSWGGERGRAACLNVCQ